MCDSSTSLVSWASISSSILSQMAHAPRSTPLLVLLSMSTVQQGFTSIRRISFFVSHSHWENGLMVTSYSVVREALSFRCSLAKYLHSTLDAFRTSTSSLPGLAPRSFFTLMQPCSMLSASKKTSRHKDGMISQSHFLLLGDIAE